jgi:hypothetical protein
MGRNGVQSPSMLQQTPCTQFVWIGEHCELNRDKITQNSQNHDQQAAPGT